jgi:hypothetical protein
MASFPTPINSKAAILQKRHITNEQAEVLKVGPMPLEEANTHLKYRIKGSVAYVESLPYWDAEGHPLGDPQFYRFRINYTPGWEPPEGDWKEYPKYRSPYRKGEFAYLPRGVGMDWLAISGEPQVPIIITEGEYKAIRVCSAWDKPCIGLGGVWMFHANKPGWPAGFDMNLMGRDVYIVYDADSESTDEHPLKGGVSGVDGASRRLANKLYQAGARPKLLYIARTATFAKARTKDLNAKMGIDDFIDAGGTWEELAGKFEDPIAHAGLAYLFNRYALCRGVPVGIVEIDTGTFYRINDWRDVEANCIANDMVEKGGKMVPIRLQFTKIYMEHESRPEFTKWSFEPSLSTGLDQEAGTYNRWKGMAVEGHVGPGEAERYQEIVAIWKKFSAGVCGSGRDYAELWMADIFQNPGRKTTQAMLIRSALNGIGKTLLVEILRDMIGVEHSARVTLDHALHHFNALMGDKVLVQIDEANDVQKQYDSALKNLVTAEDAVITLKGRDSIIVKNYARIFITSNSVAPIMLDEHNRRFFVMEPALTIEDETGEWAKWVGDVVAKELRSPEGLRMLRWYFDTIDLSNWKPTAHAPRTEAMMDVVEASTTKNTELLGQIWKDYKDDPSGIWVVGGKLTATPEAKRLWAGFKDRVKNSHGQVISHVMKLPGETKSRRVNIFVRGDVEKLPTRHIPDQGMSLLPGLDLKDVLVKGMNAAVAAYSAWEGVLPSSKF